MAAPQSTTTTVAKRNAAPAGTTFDWADNSDLIIKPYQLNNPQDMIISLTATSGTIYTFTSPHAARRNDSLFWADPKEIARLNKWGTFVIDRNLGLRSTDIKGHSVRWTDEEDGWLYSLVKGFMRDNNRTPRGEDWEELAGWLNYFCHEGKGVEKSKTVRNKRTEASSSIVRNEHSVSVRARKIADIKALMEAFVPQDDFVEVPEEDEEDEDEQTEVQPSM